MPAGPPRVNLVHLTDCLLSHAARASAPRAARALPAMAGAGLARVIALAATDADSAARVRRAVDAWGRKGLLEPGYLKLGYERLDAAAAALKAAADAAAATAAAAPRGAHARGAARGDRRQVRARLARGA